MERKGTQSELSLKHQEYKAKMLNTQNVKNFTKIIEDRKAQSALENYELNTLGQAKTRNQTGETT